MRRISRSKSPQLHQLEIMAENLCEVSGKAVKVEINTWHHENGMKSIQFQFAFVPGFKKDDCTHVDCETWEELFNEYYYYINGGEGK